jgi:carbamoylphosphate synthase large subunit
MTARRDKGLMKDAVGRGGLRVAKHARVGSLADLRTAMTRMSLDYPIVVKTPSGMSTTDVLICSNEKETDDALSSIVGKVGPDGRTTPAALLEEYIGGEEFAINLMAFEGSHLLVTDIWKYSKTNKARYEHAEICNPAEHPHLISYAREVAKAVGVEYGAAHVELKAEQLEDGQYANPVMIEVGARLSGGLKSTMAKEAIDNWNPFTSLIESHCGGQSRSKIEEEFLTPSQYVRHIFLPIEKEGIIEDVRMVDASQLTTLHTMAMIVKAGDHVKATTDIVSCAGFVWLVGARDQVENDAHLVLSSFSLLLDG